MCDLLCALPAATAAGRTLFAKNSDRPPAERQELVWLPPRRDRRLAATHVDVDPWPGDTIGVLGSGPAWAWGLEQGVNQAGVAAGNAAIYTTADPRGAPPGLIGIDLVRLVLERAASAEAGVEVLTGLLERHGQGGSGHEGADRPYWSSFLIADPVAAWVVETSGRQWAAARVGSTWALSNRTTIPDFDRDHRHPRQPVDRLVDPRLAAARRTLSSGPASPESLMAHLASHEGGDGGWTVCMHVDGEEVTAAALVAELGPDPATWWALGSPCSSTWFAATVGPLPAATR
jgi:secernin